MTNSVEEYLGQLRTELKGGDTATIRDALADAEEHLRDALSNLKQEQPEISEENPMNQVIEQYGDPADTAAAYMEVERRTPPSLTRKEPKQSSGLARFFGVYLDPKAWASLLYMLIAFVTGVFYFTWAVTGLSLSISFSLFIFGLPFALLFFISVRGLALLEGRLVEGLLGIRMPRRPIFTQANLKWIERLKELAMDKHTWFSLLYMFIQFILGIFYLVLSVTVISVSLVFIALPFIQTIWNIPVMTIGSERVFLPYWELILLAIGGFLSLTIFMNLSRLFGQLHGKMAKAMLVTTD